MTTHSRQPVSSLFWPLLLIAVGAVWVFVNMGILQPVNLGMLLRLWPLILIVVGVNLLLGYRNPRAGVLLSIVAVIVIVGLMLLGPALGWAGQAEVKAGEYAEPMDDTRMASVDLSLAVADTTITALTDSPSLFTADVRYLGEIEYQADTTNGKTHIRMENRGDQSTFWNFGWFEPQPALRWDIGLNPDIPLDLTINSGVGQSTLNLQDLNLTHLRLNGGVGDLRLNLPATETSYGVNLNSGAGSASITLEEGAAVTLDINGGVGNVTIDVPDQAAVRVDAETGVGNVTLPSWLEVVSRDDRTVGEDGVWQSQAFSASTRPIIITYDGGVGSLTIK